MKVITTKYSNYRYTATDSDGNRVRVNADDALDTEQNHDAAAIALCRKMRWDGPLMRGTLKPAQRVYTGLPGVWPVMVKKQPKPRRSAIYRAQTMLLKGYVKHLDKELAALRREKKGKA